MHSYATSAVLNIKCDTGIAEMWRYKNLVFKSIVKSNHLIYRKLNLQIYCKTLKHMLI